MSAAGSLSPAEVDALLRRPLLARLATIDDEGYPAVVPVWIEWDGAAIWLVARARAAYVAHIGRDARVGLSVVDDADPDRRVQIRGRASIVAGPSGLAGEMLALARRMAARYEGEPGLAYIERSLTWPRCLVRIAPQQVRSWAAPGWHPRYLPEPAPDDTGEPA